MALRPAFLSCPFKLRKTDTILLLIDLEIFTLRDIPRENAELTCDIPERADDTILLKPDLVTLRIVVNERLYICDIFCMPLLVVCVILLVPTLDALTI